MDVMTNRSTLMLGISIKLVHKMDDIASKLSAERKLFQPTHGTFLNVNARLMWVHRIV